MYFFLVLFYSSIFVSSFCSYYPAHILFEYNDKRIIYWLIDQYLTNKISLLSFSEEFYKSYALEVDFDTLTEKEEAAFDSLAEVSNRFTTSEEDLKNYPGVYFTPEELRKKISETKEALKDCWIKTT